MILNWACHNFTDEQGDIEPDKLFMKIDCGTKEYASGHDTN